MISAVYRTPPSMAMEIIPLVIKEQIIFPEIDVDKVTRVSGMDVTFVTTAKNDVEAYELLKELGMPFIKRQEIVQPETQNK